MNMIKSESTIEGTI